MLVLSEQGMVRGLCNGRKAFLDGSLVVRYADGMMEYVSGPGSISGFDRAHEDSTAMSWDLGWSNGEE